MGLSKGTGHTAGCTVRQVGETGETDQKGPVGSLHSSTGILLIRSPFSGRNHTRPNLSNRRAGSLPLSGGLAPGLFSAAGTLRIHPHTQRGLEDSICLWPLC